MTPAAVDPTTLDFIWQNTKDAPERQLHDVEAFDAKAIQVFAAASIVVGLATLVGDLGGTVATVFLALTLAAYALSVAFAITALSVRTFAFTRQADRLWPDYWDQSAEQIKHAMVANIAESYTLNKEQLDRKANACQRLIWSTGAEAIFIGCAVLAARLA